MILSFKCFNRFINNFKNRNMLIMRKGTHLVQKETDITFKKIESFLSNLQDVKMKFAMEIFQNPESILKNLFI